MALENNNTLFKEIQRIGKLSKDGVFIYHMAESVISPGLHRSTWGNRHDSRHLLLNFH